jgi:hypothetical protein
MPARLLSVTVAVAVAAVGCSEDGGGVDRASYVKKNLAVLETVPPFPGARAVGVQSVAYRATEQSDAVAGYGTIRGYHTPARTRPSSVVAFYRRELRQDWRVVDVSTVPTVSLRRGDAYLYIMAGPGGVNIEIDHDCYKGGPSPVCFGP